MDISMSFPLCSFLRKIPVLYSPSWPCASWTVSKGIPFDHYHHRCQDFCSLHGFCLTLENKQDTQLRLGVQNLASSGARMVAYRSGLTCHVILSVGSLKIEFFFFCNRVDGISWLNQVPVVCPKLAPPVDCL